MTGQDSSSSGLGDFGKKNTSNRDSEKSDRPQSGQNKNNKARTAQTKKDAKQSAEAERTDQPRSLKELQKEIVIPNDAGGLLQALTKVTVQRGDSVWKIAAANLPENASKQQISKLVNQIGQINKLADLNRIYPGQELVVPGTIIENKDEQSQLFTGDKFIVQKGDTLWDIAGKVLGREAPDRLKLQLVWEIAGINSLQTPNEIHIGQVLKLPVNSPLWESGVLVSNAETDRDSEDA